MGEGYSDANDFHASFEDEDAVEGHVMHAIQLDEFLPSVL